MKYTFNEICESQDFEHNQEFVEIEDYKALQSRCDQLEKLAREIFSFAKSPDPYDCFAIHRLENDLNSILKGEA